MTLSQGGREGGTKKNVIKQTSRESTLDLFALIPFKLQHSQLVSL